MPLPSTGLTSALNQAQTYAHVHTDKHNRPVCWHVVWITPQTPCLPESQSLSLYVCVCVPEWVYVGSSWVGLSGNNKGQFHPNYHPDYHYIKEPFMAFINTTTKAEVMPVSSPVLVSMDVFMYIYPKGKNG